MSVLEKAVVSIYICLAIVIGGLLAYLNITFGENGYSSLIGEKLLNKNNKFEKNGQVVNVDSNLCIRKEPSFDSEVFYMLYEGMIFEILGKEGQWYKIHYNNINGYVNDQYVEEYNDIPPNPTYNDCEQRIIFDIFKKMPKPISSELTAYCNCSICSESWGSETAMQTQTRVGVVATPKDITLGSKLYIPDLEYYKEDCIFDVEDRGGAVRVKEDGTYIIDVWLPNHEEVKEFGRKKTIAYIIEN